MNYNDENLLEMIELYANEMGFIASEDELSEQFDNMLDDCCPDFDAEDEPALSEAFSGYADSLCKDGEIHPEQYSQYNYTGKHA